MNSRLPKPVSSVTPIASRTFKSPSRLAPDRAQVRRAEEREADQQGVALLLRALIDSSGLAQFFEGLSKGALNPPELLSTHPDPGNRARELRAASLSGTLRALPKPGTVRCEK